mgnify:CR=1 FL=1
MLIRLANTPRHYDWGSPSGISDLLGTRPSGLPEAELWFGTHGASPTWLVDHDEGYATLNELVFANPEQTVGNSDTVPFLLKVLAAGQPLSLQAHPSEAQAVAGFARENAAGLHLSDPVRNYRDAQSKPELIVAVSDEFVALSGFRRCATTVPLLEEIADHADSAALQTFVASFSAKGAASARDAFVWALQFLLDGSTDRDGLVEALVRVSTDPALDGNEAALIVRDLCLMYPTDPGLVVATLMNRVVLARNEALFLPAGNLHAYVRGVGIELMKASDNVLRGGLTNKHIDVAELIRVVDYSELVDPRLPPTEVSSHLTAFTPAGAGFRLFQYSNDDAGSLNRTTVQLASCAIGVVTSGTITVATASGSRTVSRGEALFISVDERDATIYGAGELFLACAV